jgi:hypothetical protein
VHNLYRHEEGRQILFSDQFFEHPSYLGSLTSLRNDIAMIKLPDAGVDFSDKISPCCLPLRSQEAEPLVGLDMVTAGWGKTGNGG